MNRGSSLDALFSPGSIILVGAAHTDRKLGGIVLRNLLESHAAIYPVNPKHKELMGIRAYASVDEVRELFGSGGITADLAVIIRPAPEVPEILKGLRGWTKTAIVVSAGFSEAGQQGLQDEIKSIGREGGIRLLGPNCLGVYDAHSGLDTFLLSREKLGRPKKGNVAVLSQSGAVLTCLFDSMRSSDTGLSKAVGYGNAADIDESEIYDYLSDDVHTDIVISYIESVGDGRKFIKAAKALSETKSLLILKAGKGRGGEAAAFSHTGRLAGRHEVFSSVLRQFGIDEAPDFDCLVDAAKALSLQRPAAEERGIAAGRRVCIITNGGGSGVLAADECMRQMLEVSQVPEEKVKKLRDIFPPFYSMNNPVDLTAQVTDSDYGVVLDLLKDDYDGFLIIALTAVTGITSALAGIIKKFRATSGRHVVLYTNAGSAGRTVKTLFEKAGIPAYPSPERAARALSTLLRTRR